MKTDAILDILVNDAFPVYSSSVATYADKQIFKEILKSLPKEHLMDVNELLEHEFGVPWELKEYIEWLLYVGAEAKPEPRRNEPKPLFAGFQTRRAAILRMPSNV